MGGKWCVTPWEREHGGYSTGSVIEKIHSSIYRENNAYTLVTKETISVYNINNRYEN